MKAIGAILLALVMLSGCQRESENGFVLPQYAENDSSEPVYRFAILPLHNPNQLRTVFEPLIAYLNKRIDGAQFEFEASRDFPSFEQKLSNREVAFALPNPYETLLAMRHGYHVFAKANKDEDFRGVFLVRRDSPIRDTRQLKGKVVAYPAPMALAASLQAQHYLQTHGLDVNRDTETRYSGSHDSALLAVYYGQAAAGATWPPTWRVFQKSHPREAAELRVAWQTEILPHLPFMVRDDVPEGVAAAVRDALLHMHENVEGRAILAAMEFDSIVSANGKTYEPVRRFVREFNKLVRPIETYQ